MEDKPNEIIRETFVIWRPNKELLQPSYPLPVKPGQEILYKKIVFVIVESMG